MSRDIIIRCLKDQNTSTKDLKSVTLLDISERNLNTISKDDFEQCPNIRELDVSANGLSEIPNDLNLLKLEELDCSHNDLQSIEFIEQFPCLKSLYITENPKIKLADKYIAAALCPLLMDVDLGMADHDLQRATQKMAAKLKLHVEGVWEALYSEKYPAGISGVAREVLHQEFVSDVCAQKDVFMVPDLRKFDEFMIMRLANDLLDRVSSGNFSRSRREKLYKNPSESTPKRTATPKQSQPKKTPMKSCDVSGNDAILRKSPFQEKENYMTQLKDTPGSKRKRSRTTMKLPPVSDYECTHVLRCHSFNNDPHDSATKVWCCAFEPDPDAVDKTTDLVATCGGNVVCLIDCRTGQVMKRYKDSNNLENFFALAWTTLEPDERLGLTNILAVAGKGKVIKLLHPKQRVMYACLSGHTQYINCLRFHPQKPKQLFSGGNDRKIILWYVGTPDLTSSQTDSGILMVLQCPGSGITTLLYCPEQQHLLAGTDDGLYAWSVYYPKDNGKKRAPSIKFVLPEMDAQVGIDGVVLVGKDLVAVKCSEQRELFLFHLNQYIHPHHSKNPKRTQISDYARLDYTHVTQPYINISCSNSILCVGDDECNIHLYNLKTVLKKSDFPTSILVQSAILKNPLPDVSCNEDKDSDELQNVIINTVGQSLGSDYIVCGTDNNLVCIWRRSLQTL